MKHSLFLIIFFCTFASFAQKSTIDTNLICWSKNRKLSIDDFQIKVANKGNSFSSAQFSYDYKVSAVFGLPKDYKKQITNCFMKSASWIDTTNNTTISLRYQQTLFDLGEIYVRQFRKFVYENRKKLAWSKINIDEINTKIMTDFAKRRVAYDTETSYGSNHEKQKNWEVKISNEIEALNEFSAE
ncbi:hypothetical protein [Arcicella rosea]|uniref:DUF4468 domain-containing protein n=1 Tax=Arcicella rosea TaxID=502909 RepID=A0A841EGI9_9BACT|nr:hypothetical protein [Arcicella rosea]MBB6002106.1 hypothetical protein [Arcicella rosea]